MTVPKHSQVGPKDAPPVLLCHGWLDNCYSFVPLLTKLPMNRRYIALDLPGHGHSSHKPKSAYTHTIGMVLDLSFCLETSFLIWRGTSSPIVIYKRIEDQFTITEVIDSSLFQIT